MSRLGTLLEVEDGEMLRPLTAIVSEIYIENAKFDPKATPTACSGSDTSEVALKLIIIHHRIFNERSSRYHIV